MDNLPSKKILAAMVSSVVLLTGCGSGSDPLADTDLGRTIDNLIEEAATGAGDGGAGTASVTDQNPYAGLASLAGSVSLSSLFGIDASALQAPKSARVSTRSAFVLPRATAPTSENAVIKLYVVRSNGELEDTGIDCAFDSEKNANGDPKYVCEGIKDGESYVVKYLRLLDNNKALELKVNVEVPEGLARAEAEPVSPESTVVADAIVNAVLSATEGKDVDQVVVREIISSVKQAVKSLVEAGAVQIPSMVVDAPKDESGNYISDASKLKRPGTAKFSKNRNLDEVTGAVLSNEKVVKEVDVAKVKIEVRELKTIDTGSNEGKRKFIERIFSKLMNGEVPPSVYVEFFAKKYLENKEVDLKSLFEAIKVGLTVSTQPEVSLDELGVAEQVAVTKFSDLLAKLYALEQKSAQGELSAAEKAQLAEIPGIISIVFPEELWLGKQLDGTTPLTVPQAIVFTLFVTDKLVADLYQEKYDQPLHPLMRAEDDKEGNTGTGDTGEGGSKPVKVRYEDPVHFNPMYRGEAGEQPGLMQLFGFFEPANLDSISGVDILRLDIMPGRVWIEDQAGPTTAGGKEYESLRAEVCVMDVSALASPSTNGIQPPTVTLSYPLSAGGVGQVALMPRGDQRGGESCFTLDPFERNQQSSEKPAPLTENDIISDFASGEYVVTATDGDGNAYTRKFKKNVIVGMQDARPTLASPRGMPQPPRDCYDQTCQNEFQLRMDAWQAAGGNSIFPLNVDDDGDGTFDKARVTIKWEKPDISLPEGVRIAYGVDIFRNGGCDTTGTCEFENIYSSHEKDRRIFTNSFVVPELLDKLETGEGSYNVNLCTEFFDMKTGEYLGSGGCAFADFQVGEPLDLNARFLIKGKGVRYDSGNWKIALIAEKPYFSPADDATYHEPEREVLSVTDIGADGSYSLDPSLGGFLGKPFNTFFNIVAFDDVDNDYEVDFGSPVQPGEPVFWPSWETQIRFETWGGILRVVRERSSADDSEFKREEIVVRENSEIEGPDFSAFEDNPASFPDSQTPTSEGGEATGDSGSDAAVNG